MLIFDLENLPKICVKIVVLLFSWDICELTLIFAFIFISNLKTHASIEIRRQQETLHVSIPVE